MKLCILLALVPLCMCAPTDPLQALGNMPDPPEHTARVVAGLIGTCTRAMDCMKEHKGENKALIREYSRGGKLMREGGENEMVDDLCTVAESRHECLDQCDEPVADGSLMALGNRLDTFMCQERMADVKEALGCFKEVFTQGSPMEALQNEHCSACQPMVAEMQRWPATYGNDTYWEGKALKDMVDVLNSNTGAVGKVCTLLHCSLGCLEHIAESKCGDAKHGTVLRDFVAIVNQFSNDVADELSLDCLVPNTCRTMHEA